MSWFPLIKRILKLLRLAYFFPSPLHFTDFRRKGPKVGQISALGSTRLLHRCIYSPNRWLSDTSERGYLKPKTVLPAATFYTMNCSIKDKVKIHFNTAIYKEISNTDCLLIFYYPSKTYKQCRFFNGILYFIQIVKRLIVEYARYEVLGYL